MKLFIATISLLFGIIIGAGITTFLVIKKNPMIKGFLCASQEINTKNAAGSPLSVLNNIDLNKFLPQEKATASPAMAEKTSAITSGPGGCANEDECLKYCSNLDHLQECLAFAKTHLNQPQAPASQK